MRSKVGLPRLNPQARRWLAGERRWPSARAAAWVKRFVEQTCHSPNTVAVVLIGSLARTTHDPSDVDLLYVFDGEPVAFKDHPIDVDIRAYGTETFISQLSSQHDVITWALRFGRIICERDMFWSALISSFGGDLPLPSPDVTEERARRATEVYGQLVEIGDHDAALEQRISLLTHRGWTQLLRKHIHPASRSELPEQLRAAGETSLAVDLASALRERAAARQASAIQELTPHQRAG